MPADSCAPSFGRQRCDWYLVSRAFDEAIPLHWHDLVHIPEIDVCVIRFPRSAGLVMPYAIREVNLSNVVIVLGLGHHGGFSTPDECAVMNGRFYMRKMSTERLRHDLTGVVLEIRPFNEEIDGITLREVEGILATFNSVRGMSGGPLIDVPTGQIVGMNSFGTAVDHDHRSDCVAISINRIVRELRLRGIEVPLVQ
jgi:hypothetical protein